MLSVLLFCWAVLKLLIPSTCHPLQEASSPSEAMTGGPDMGHGDESKISMINYFMEKKSNDGVWKTIQQGSRGIFKHLKKKIEGSISVLHVKSNTFLCLDFNGKLYTSKTDTNVECQFHHVKRRKHYYEFHAVNGDVLVIFQHAKDHKYVPVSSELNFLLLKRQRKLRHPRQRRSWTIDPSDPLGSEYPGVRSVHHNRRDPPWSSNVSKETISSIDDPLQVLLSDSPLSPTLEKVRGHRKVRF